MKVTAQGNTMMLKTSGCFCLLALIMLSSLVSQGICAVTLEPQWYTRYDNAVTSNEDYGNVVATDVNGNVYVAGQTEAPPYSNFEDYHEHVVVKYDSSGTEQWAYHHGDISPMPNDSVKEILVDDEGNVYVAACGNIIHVAIGNYSYDYLILKLDPQGNLLWEYLHGEGTYRTRPYDLALDDSGNVYVTGTVQDTQSLLINDLLTIKH